MANLHPRPSKLVHLIYVPPRKSCYIREKITHIRTALGQRSDHTTIKALHRCTTGAMQQCNGEGKPQGPRNGASPTISHHYGRK
jgi:hypothetical protein